MTKDSSTESETATAGLDSGQGQDKALESWKEIAVYLQRDVSTVRRWEKSENLPVRRHLHLSRASVYAYPSELDAWRAARQPGVETAAGPLWRRPVPSLAFSLVLALSLISVGNGPQMGPAEAQAADGSGIVLRQVWAGPEVDLFGTPSLDGKYISFVDWETGDLAIHNLETGENRRLTNKGSYSDSWEQAEFSTVSPDGSQVAYNWLREDGSYELRVVGLDGSEPRVVFHNEEVPWLMPTAWSPDGQRILAALFRKGKGRQIALVSVADGSVQVMKTLAWRGTQKMSLSPDGRYIVYDFRPDENSRLRDIFLLATDGSRETPLTSHPADDRNPLWTPDGTRIVFASDRTGVMGIWSQAILNGKPVGPPTLVKRDLGKGELMGFSQDGTLYYGFNSATHDVYTASLDLETGKLTQSKPAVRRFLGSSYAPDWSPDGRYLACLSQPGPFSQSAPQRLLIRSLGDEEERELSLDLGFPSHNPYHVRPRWSPDGRSLAVLGRGAKGPGIYRVDVETANVTPLVLRKPGERLRHHEWAPDGQAMFYVRPPRAGKGPRILRRDLKTGSDRELYSEPVKTWVPDLALSPDGMHIAYTVSPTETLAIVKILPAGGGQPREIVPIRHIRRGLAWTPDGSHLIIFGNPLAGGLEPSHQTELWKVPAAGGDAVKFEPTAHQLAGLRFHPDGQQVAFGAGKNKKEIWALQNFLPETGGVGEQ